MTQESGFRIRTFREGDYEDIVILHNRIYPDIKQSVESLRYNDEKKSDKCGHHRFIGELNGKVIGHGLYTQFERDYRPGKYNILIMIDPEYRANGYGKMFYDHVIEELKKHDPTELVCNVREDKKKAIQFLEKRGYIRFLKEWLSVLDVDGFDMEEYRGLEEKLAEEGISLTSLANIEHCEENKNKLYEIHEEIMEDVPMQDEYTGTDYYRYIDYLFDHPYSFLDGFILAMKKDEFIGMSSNFHIKNDNYIFTGLTGVKKEHRGKGIATAMKVKLIKKAKEKGIPKIKTSNEKKNEGIIHINNNLGFENKAAWISFKKEL
ncbi:MAG: GNAT family N-acetyltransferase [Thermoplasmata archaeon]